MICCYVGACVNSRHVTWVVLAWCLNGVLVTHPFSHQVALLVLDAEPWLKSSKRICLYRQLSSCVCAGWFILLQYFVTFAVSSLEMWFLSFRTCHLYFTPMDSTWSLSPAVYDLAFTFLDLAQVIKHNETNPAVTTRIYDNISTSIVVITTRQYAAHA